MSRSQAASCHSLVVRMPGPVDAGELEERLRSGAAGALDAPGDLRLWQERLPYAATDPAAAARVRREAERPLRTAGLPLRAVLLHYRDGDADLVLVARRTLSLDPGTLACAPAPAAAPAGGRPVLELAPIHLFEPTGPGLIPVAGFCL
ncbi:hypothetical protein GPJ59_32920, partial [Streptomyces bambusae]|nr:hypothetical protein [Streptomyces bambusae]